MHAACAVDYATRILLYDNFDLVRRIIETIILPTNVQAMKKMELVLVFLKAKFAHHVIAGSKEGVNNKSGYNIRYGLHIPNENEEGSDYTCADPR
jgi:hypothetical protein